MFFRNASIYRFSPAVALDLARLEEALVAHKLRPVGPMEMGSHGFVPPIGKHEGAAMTHTVNDCTLFTAGSHDKILPAAAVNDELARRVQQITDADGRKVGGRERKKIKEDVLNELLPRALTKEGRTRAYTDGGRGWLVIDTASRRTAENVISQVRQALGSFPAIPPAPEESPRVLMTHWLADGGLPEGLTLGDECELRDPATGGAVSRSRNQDLDAEEIKEHLRGGKQVFQLGLVYADRVSFVLGDDLTLRKVRFLDAVLDDLGSGQDDAASEMDARFALLSLELGLLLDKLEEWFHLPRPKDA